MFQFCRSNRTLQTQSVENVRNTFQRLIITGLPQETKSDKNHPFPGKVTTNIEENDPHNCDPRVGTCQNFDRDARPIFGV